MRGDQLAAAVYGTPWAILPQKAEVIAEFVRRRLAGEATGGPEFSAARPEKRRQVSRGGVAIVPIHGTITQRAGLLSDWSGGTSAEEAGREIEALAADPTVSAIVLDVDSPGGSVYGVEELGAKIAAAAKTKKVIASVNSVAASAAYWVASQASEIVVTPSGEVGSIGVVTMHRDVSQALAAAGQKVTILTTSPLKAAGHPYGPLEGEAMADVMTSLNDYHDKFVRAVAKGRGATLTAVREGFGRGGMVRADQAVTLGMADRVGTLDEVLARYGMATTGPRADADVAIRRRRMGDGG